MSNESLHVLIERGHRYFAVECFNLTWTYVAKPDRTKADDEAMILCASASLWHWTQRPDCTDKNRSIGHWQLSRVYALAGRGSEAMDHAHQALLFARGLSPFYIGYAHEAAARASLVQHYPAGFRDHFARAQVLLHTITDAEERAMLERDLEALHSAATQAGALYTLDQGPGEQ